MSGLPRGETWTEVTAAVERLIGPDAERAFRQLRKVAGAETAELVLAQCHEAIGGGAIDTPQDLLKLGQALVQVGGFIGVVGRSFRVAGICKGAKLGSVSPPTSP